MSLLDSISDGFNKLLPAKSKKLKKNRAPPELGGGPGHINHDDEDEISKPAIVFHAAQAFFNFLAMCCMASVAGFQAKWIGGPSGLTGFAIFLSIAGIILPLFMLIIPVVYDKHNKFIALARALRELRICLILTGGGSLFSLLIAFIVTISVSVEPGCKDATTDPNAGLGKDFQAGLDGWCATKRAAAVFFWLAFFFWVASFVLLVLHYRSGRIYRTALGSGSGAPRDPPFDHTQLGIRARGTTELDDGGETEIGDGESTYEHGAPPMEHRTSAYDPYVAPGPPRHSSDYDGLPPRQSIDAYGAFNDPPPSGFAPPPQVRSIPEEEPRVSRTMQYADPYAAVRARVGPTSPTRGVLPPPNIPTSAPPGYDAYQNEYR